MENQIIKTEEVQEVLEVIKQTTKMKEALPLIQELEEILTHQEEQAQAKEETLQVQINQLKEENKRLNHL